jgi:hypothetical protein
MKTFCPISLLSKLNHDKLPLTWSPRGNRGLVEMVKAFFLAFVSCADDHPEPARRLPNSSLPKLSSVTTTSGPWVYTVVPWED